MTNKQPTRTRTNANANAKGNTHMPTPDEHLAGLKDWMQENSDALDALDKLQVALHKAKADLAAVEAEHAQTKSALAVAQRGLTQSQFDAIHDYDQRLFSARAELTEAQQTLPQAHADLAGTEKALEGARQRHVALEGHIEASRKAGLAIIGAGA
jgi:predicted  nucleic acid-binding Zn-ribbon protein